MSTFSAGFSAFFSIVDRSSRFFLSVLVFWPLCKEIFHLTSGGSPFFLSRYSFYNIVCFLSPPRPRFFSMSLPFIFPLPPSPGVDLIFACPCALLCSVASTFGKSHRPPFFPCWLEMAYSAPIVTGAVSFCWRSTVYDLIVPDLFFNEASLSEEVTSRSQVPMPPRLLKMPILLAPF